MLAVRLQSDVARVDEFEFGPAAKLLAVVDLQHDAVDEPLVGVGFMLDRSVGLLLLKEQVDGADACLVCGFDGDV